MGRVLSHSENLTYGFYVQMENHGSGSISGAYWSLEGDMNSLLTVQNMGEEEDKVTIELAHNGGSFVLPEIPLQPNEARTLNLRALIAAGVTNQDGNPFPGHAREGGYRITSANRFTGKLVTKEQLLSSSARISIPFYSVCDYVTDLYFQNSQSTVNLRISQTETVYPVCDWNYGTTAAPDASVWSSNTSKATVSPTWGSSRTVKAVNVGQASLQASAQAPEQIGPDECEPGFFSAPPLTIIVEIVDLEGSLENIPISNDGQAIIAHENFTLRVEAVHPTTGQRITTYSGSATASFGSLKAGESISPNPVQLTNGVGTASVKLTAVNSNGDTGRTYTLAGPPLAPFTGSVKVWFKVNFDLERY